MDCSLKKQTLYSVAAFVAEKVQCLEVGEAEPGANCQVHVLHGSVHVTRKCFPDTSSSSTPAMPGGQCVAKTFYSSDQMRK